MRHALTLLITVLLLAPVALAHTQGNSAEEIVVRVTDADLDARTYTLHCDVPKDTVSPRTWSVRSTKNATTIYDGQDGENLTFTFAGDALKEHEAEDLWHIACQVETGENRTNKRGDHHIDLRSEAERTSAYPDTPNIVVNETDGTSFTATCLPPENNPTDTVHWEILYAHGDGLHSYDGPTTTSKTLEKAGLWDIRCDVGDTYWPLPVEFFETGPAYVPSLSGCVPGEPCYLDNATDTNTTDNTTDDTTGDNTTGTDDNTTDTNTTGDTCYSGVATIPVTCEGDTITSDTYDGCRHITCGTVEALACDKTETSFEAYKQSGSGATVCFGDACVGEYGYAQGTLPYCTDTTTDNTTDNTTDDTTGDNTTDTTNATGACYDDLTAMPASCEGGTITSDTYDGCRTLICENGTNSLQVLACEKTGEETHFELYRQAETGSGLNICVAGVCIDNLGYAQSGPYPVCTDDATSDNTTDDTTGDNTTDTGDNTTGACYSGVATIPVTCSGGTIQEDTYDGCRQVLCTDGGNSVQALACDKSETSFEAYRQFTSGDGIEVCYGDTCVGEWGYAQGTLPYCTGETTDTNISAPHWIEPTADSTDVHPVDFHIHAEEPESTGGETHTATDFEIHDSETGERVWHATDSTILHHIHSGDGTFENSRAGTGQLAWNHSYQLRARFDTTNATGPWSEWRHFTTQPQPATDPTEWDWTPMDGYKIERVAQDVNLPAVLEEAPTSYYGHLAPEHRPKLYFTHLYGGVSVIRNDGAIEQYASGLLNFAEFGSLPGSGEVGLTGLYADPATGDLFISIVYAEDDRFLGRVERFTSNADGTGYTDRQTLIQGIPVAPSHQVHEITRGPDGKLYLHVGDADRIDDAQDTTTLNGKILRFNEDGTIPDDNPYGNAVWAGGFRNTMDGEWHPGTGEYYITHNGPDHNDAIFNVKEGEIYGWGSGGDTSEGAWYLWPDSTAPTTLGFDEHDALGNGQDTLYVALSGPTYSTGPADGAKSIEMIGIAADGTSFDEGTLVEYTGEGYGAPIGLETLSDGLYYTDMYGESGFTSHGTTKGNIYRVTPGTQTENPNAGDDTAFSASLGPAPWYPQDLEMVWECKAIGGSGAYTYDYSFGDGDQLLGHSEDRAYHEYASAGTYEASCTVHDQELGASVSASASVTLGNRTGTDNTTDDGDTCVSTVSELPVTCTTGDITEDTIEDTGCRTITCSNADANKTVRACDKTDLARVEVYLVSGEKHSICVGDACINENGFASSEYPYCS